MALVKQLPPFRVYRELEADEHICIFADPAESNDYCAAVGISKRHADTPIVFNERIESSQFGHELYHMAKFVERVTHIWPTIGVERNTGQATIHVLVTLNYPELFRMRIFDVPGIRESEKIGWLTTEATRNKMLDNLALALRQGQTKTCDREVVEQICSFIVDKKGKARAESNKKDDLVISYAGAWQLYSLVATRVADDYNMEEWRQDQEKWRFR